MARILFCVSGSIAAFKAAQVVSKLAQNGHDVHCAVSDAARRFVGDATWEGLSGNPAATDLWAPGRAMEHIRLEHSANLTILCPATADRLNKMASGTGGDLLGALFLAHDFSHPFLVTPAMNTAMWNHPVTRDSVAKLSEMGLRFVATGAGNLACGEIGDGRLAEPTDILAAIDDALRPLPARRFRVLVTSGGTRVAIDSVRFLTNASTGKTGAAIADSFARAGHLVTLLHAEGAAFPESKTIARRSFVTVDDLDLALRETLSSDSFDLCVHAAAVSDFALENPPTGKIDSSRALTLTLVPGPKLLPRLKGYSKNPKLVVVGFKLLADATPEQASSAIANVLNAGADAVVYNDSRGYYPSTGAHAATIHFPRAGTEPVSVASNAELAAKLVVVATEILIPVSGNP